MKTPPPTPVWQCLISVGGDTRDDVIRLIESFLNDLRRGSDGPIVSGGAGSGGYLTITHNKDVTPETYQIALETWMEQQKKEGGAK